MTIERRLEKIESRLGARPDSRNHVVWMGAGVSEQQAIVKYEKRNQTKIKGEDLITFVVSKIPDSDRF